MASFRKLGAGLCWGAALALALGAAPAKPGVGKAKSVLENLKKIDKAKRAEAAKEKDEKKETSAAAKALMKPAKTVSPPTITPAEIDELMQKHLANSKVPLAAPTTDIEFVRRVYLDLTGKLPTPEQVRAFCQTREKGKRAKLIEFLLGSDDYATNWAHYWRDVIQFRATNENVNQIRYDEMEAWLAGQFAKNRPWDETARAMIAATGRNDEENPVGFVIAHGGQAVEMAGEVSRIFMGIQIQCAQCHDHPNDSWKREQFHQFAAFFANSRVKRVGDPKAKGPAVFEVVSQGKPVYKMPDKKDPTKSSPVDPLFFLDAKAKPLPAGLTAQERREIAASYVVSQDNPWFAKSFVNRVWYLLMGEGFYNPVDDIGPEREAKAGAVIDALAAQWAQGGYDVKWLLRTILNTQTYQREIRSTYSATGKVAFASNAPSRLRSDQILDSLHQVLGLPTGDANEAKPPGQGPGQGKGQGKGKGQVKALADDLKDAVKAKGKGRGPGGPRRAFNNLYGIDPSTPYDDVVGTIPQALFLMNGPQVNNAMKAAPNTMLGRLLTTTPDTRAALQSLYLRVLAREPTAAELKVLKHYIEQNGNRAEAFEDILWSLINSTEFITRR